MSKATLWNNAPIPARLREGRRVRGVTQAELSEELGLSKQAISQYEVGSICPKPEVFARIADVLELPYEYFFKPIPYAQEAPIFFRKGKTATKRDYEMFEGKIGWTREIYHYLSSFVNFPEFKLPTYTKEEYSMEDVHNIATELRAFWGLGQGPISNIVLLLENNGIIVSKISVGVKKVDACSVFTLGSEVGRPVIFLTPDTSAVRSRRDAMHEIGHHVLHSWVDKEYFNKNKAKMEIEAEWFAMAFLVPPDAIKREAFSISSLESLLLLKKRWKVSAQSILYYLRDMNLISSNQFSYLSRNMYARRWRQSEPFDDEIEQEEPILLTQAIKLILDGGVRTPSQIVDELRLPAGDIECLSGLEKGSLSVNCKKNVLLKLVK